MTKTKALISFPVTAKLICVFVFTYAKIKFSHDEAHFSSAYRMLSQNAVIAARTDRCAFEDIFVSSL